MYDSCLLNMINLRKKITAIKRSVYEQINH